jgi:hypothetical protein
MAKSKPVIPIGKFDILATFAYAKARLDGFAEEDAKERGMVAAILGEKAKLGHVTTTHTNYQADKAKAAKKKKKTITAAGSFASSDSAGTGAPSCPMFAVGRWSRPPP